MALKQMKIPASKKKAPIKARSKSGHKGAMFERLVQEILEDAKSQSDGRLTYKSKQKLKLQSGEVVIPDFSIKIEKPHEVRHFQIECQNRDRSTKEVLHKIHYVRTKHHAKTFIFVYARKLGAELEKGFRREGVLAHNLKQFREYIHDEAVVTGLVWSSSSFVRSEPVPAKAEKLALLSKMQSAFYSHPDSKSQIEEFLNRDSNTQNNGASQTPSNLSDR